MRKNERPEAVHLSSSLQEFLAGLIAGESVTAIAERIGVAPSTLYRWRKLPNFQRALQEAGRRSLDATMRHLEGESAAMAEVILALAADENTPAATRLSAARTVLDTVIAWRREFLESRLDELEQAIESYRREWRDGHSA